ncbi:MAG TPA: serine hydrolase [Puia sp.]|nr:serine hydrolase [Puia sp.]
MPKLTVFLGGLLSFVMAFSQPAAVTIKKLDAVLTQLNGRHQFNGTVLYAENGKVLYKKAFGFTDFRSGQPLQTSSSFNLASITKQFVDMGILQLYEQGKLQLDEPVKKYIPELPYEDITLRHLMTHTSGIPEYFDLFTRYKGTLDTLDNESMIRLFARYHPPLDFKTGTAWQYCNTNYVLLASIIERVSGQPLRDFFRRQIAIPLGLKDSYIYNVLMPSIPANHVIGFREDNGQAKLFDLTNMDGVTGDGNCYSSVEDLYKWEQSLYGEKLVKKETLALAFQPVKLADGSTYPYGFGWFIAKEHELYWHTGSWQGFKNLIYRDVQRHRTLIILSSGEETAGRSFAKALFEGKDYPIPSSRLITHVQVIDGTGAPRREAAVRIVGNTITEVGTLKSLPGEEIIDGGGKVLAPGFIDSHSHVEGSLQEYPEAIATLNQGVTTIVTGQDGFSSDIDSIKAGIARRPIAINVATYTGHSTLRAQVMGARQLNRPATGGELGKMAALLKAEMQKGSLGLSTGLEYEPAYFSNRDEVLQMAKVSAAANGRYISHLRSEDFDFANALDEIITIGREAKLPVQISHIKIALKDDWDNSPGILAQLETARRQGIDITADCYPYEYWHSTLKVLFPKTDYTNPVSAEFAVNHTFDPAGSVVDKFAANPAYAGKTLTEIAGLRQETPARTLMGLIAAADSFAKQHPDIDEVESIDGKSMADEDVVNFLSWANTNICSDGANGGHPRGYGSFTRVLGYYVRERKIMSLEAAIRKMTGLTAEHTGLKGRGIIAPGYFADLVLLDPETVRDHATIQSPKALSSGIEKVWVNGVCVYEHQEATREYPGMFLSR